MIRYFIIAWISLVVISSAKAQFKGAFYFEGLGSGMKVSFNYDRRFGSDTDGLGFRIGIGQSWHGFSVPFQVNTLIGEGNNKLELGVGLTYFNSASRNATALVPNLTVMYRYQRSNSVFFRLGWSPLFFLDEPNEGWVRAYRIWPGISLGFYIE